MPLSTENVNLLGFLDQKAGFFFFLWHGQAFICEYFEG